VCEFALGSDVGCSPQESILLGARNNRNESMGYARDVGLGKNKKKYAAINRLARFLRYYVSY
jgi:hypothetical protein